MKWNNRGHEFDDIAQKITDGKNKYCLWGMGYYGEKFFRRMHNKIQICEIYDKVRCGERIKGYIVKDPKDISSDYPIIVTAVSRYSEISHTLTQMGLKENVDFFYGEFFLKIFLAYSENTVNISRVDISITKKCSLRCRKCNMFMPHYQDPKNKTLGTIMHDLELFFSKVSHLDTLDILGGEPCLHPNFPELLVRIKKTYGDRIDRIAIVSNGTIPFSNKLISILDDPIFFVSISDYSQTVGYRDKLDKLISDFERANIKYEIDNGKTWLDFGFPDHPRKNESEESIIRHFHSCFPPFRGLCDGKLYRCHVSESAVESGLFPKEATFDYHGGDYLDLERDISVREFVEFDEGYSKEGFVSFCRACNGCGKDNTTCVPVAEQLIR